MLYNFNDKPEHLYYRMKLNAELCEELDANIYSFPMKYHPIDNEDYYMNRRKYRFFKAVRNNWQEEILKYCTSQVGVNISDVVIASHLIDSYLGKSFSVNEISETVNVSAKHRGKLKHYPIAEIVKITELVITPLGVTRQDIALDKLVLDTLPPKLEIALPILEILFKLLAL